MTECTIDISECTIDISEIYHSAFKKVPTFLNESSTWIKKDEDSLFDVSIGAYDEEEFMYL